MAIMKYADFLGGKRLRVEPSGVETVGRLSRKMFPFQRDITRWALRMGKAAIWADCGLGKSWMALEWGRVVHRETGRPVLILTPLAVARQFVHEGEKIGVHVTHVREAEDLTDGINVANYERLHKFDPSTFAGIVLDESSILKDFTGKTRNALIESFEQTPFKLCCTATPAPNDFMELGNHAEFLGAMTRAEMLAMFFVHDGGETQKWRLKGHAADDFWRWISSWAVNMRLPSDLGYDNSGFVLPPLRMHEHIVAMDTAMARDAGLLFTVEARTLSEQRNARRASMAERVSRAAAMVNASDEPWLVWCELNAESEALRKAIPDAVEVKGADSAEAKESRMWGFTAGDHRVLVTKPSIGGWGMNWQHCHNVAFVGIGHSFESWYQAIRRTYRFGQEHPVDCHMIISDADGAVATNLARKQRDAETMSAKMIVHMAALNRKNMVALTRTETPYNPAMAMMLPNWLVTQEAV